MLDKVALWQRLEPVVGALGFGLFDLDLPGRQGGVLRLYISARRAATGGSPEEGEALEGEAAHREGSVSIDHCAEVSRAILRLPDVEELLPGNTLLEVSSPGVNRRLSLRDHFEGAVSERVKITFAEPDGGSRTVRGVLAAVTAASSGTSSAASSSSGQSHPKEGESGLGDPESSGPAHAQAGGAGATASVYRRLYGSRAQWQVVVRIGESGEQLVVPGNKISRARVDFDFSTVRDAKGSLG